MMFEFVLICGHWYNPYPSYPFYDEECRSVVMNAGSPYTKMILFGEFEI